LQNRFRGFEILFHKYPYQIAIHTHRRGISIRFFVC